MVSEISIHRELNKISSHKTMNAREIEMICLLEGRVIMNQCHTKYTPKALEF